MSAVFMSPHWLNLKPKITQNQHEQQLVKMTAPK